MTTRAEVAAQARGWIGVPWKHQGRTRNGCDCGGLVGAVAMALGIVPTDWWEHVFDPQFGGYSRQPAHGTLQRVCELFMHRVDEPQVGDVLLMSFTGEPQHLAIVGDYRHGGLSMIHALSNVGRVAEHRFSPEWRSRVVACYGMPGVG